MVPTVLDSIPAKKPIDVLVMFPAQETSLYWKRIRYIGEVATIDMNRLTSYLGLAGCNVPICWAILQ